MCGRITLNEEKQSVGEMGELLEAIQKNQRVDLRKDGNVSILAKSVEWKCLQ